MPIGKWCKYCNKSISEPTKKVYVPVAKRTHPDIAYKTIIPEKKWYIFTYCNTECYRKYKKRKKHARKLSSNDKKLILERDKGRCIVCGTTEKIEYAHIKAAWLGGLSTPQNMVLLCHYHHAIFDNRTSKPIFGVKKWNTTGWRVINPKWKRLQKEIQKYIGEYHKNIIKNNGQFLKFNKQNEMEQRFNKQYQHHKYIKELRWNKGLSKNIAFMRKCQI